MMNDSMESNSSEIDTLLEQPHENNQLEYKTTCVTRDYELMHTRVLGIGHHGKIIEALHRPSHIYHAVKILLDTPEARKEISVQWACRDCPDIVKIIDVYANYAVHPKSQDYTACLFVVMERIRALEDHSDLLDYVAFKQQLSEQETKHILLRLARTLKFMHDRGFVHRDLKPENVVISQIHEDANGLVHIDVKLADFGFATQFPLNLAHPPPYTTDYVAPEVVKAIRSFRKTRRSSLYDAKCDMWALGIVAYIMLSGSSPFNEGQLHGWKEHAIANGEIPYDEEVWDAISPDAKSVVRGLLTTDPADRWSADTLLACNWLADLGQATLPLI